MKNALNFSEKAEQSGTSPRQTRAIEALLSGCSRAEAAVAAGVTPRALRKWFNDPTFCAALTRASDQTLSDATHRLTGTFDQAVAVLTQIMNNPQARDYDRLRAAALILRRGLDLVDQKLLNDRITALESQFNLDLP
jgi:hypothetical protein